MNNEQQELLYEVYEDALMEYGFESLPSTPTGTWFETIETFIHKCKIDNEFSEKWGLKIEERDLSLEERNDYYTSHYLGKDKTKMEELDRINIPTRLITVIYNNEKIESYI